MDTVRILAWGPNPDDVAGALKGRDWVRGLLQHMEFEATVKMRLTGDKMAELIIDSPRARHLVGRRGANLEAITYLLQAVTGRQQLGWTYTLSIEGGERRDDRRDGERRNDRHDDERRGGRRNGARMSRDQRDDRRDSRRRRDERGRDRDGEGRGEQRSERDLERLRGLSRRLAQEALDTGEPIRIRRALNSFERRVVHMTIAGIDGVSTTSEGEGSHKTVLIVADAAS